MHVEIRMPKSLMIAWIILAAMTPAIALLLAFQHEEPALKTVTAIGAILAAALLIGYAWYLIKSRLVLTDEAIELHEPFHHVWIPWNEVTESVLAGTNFLIVKAGDGTVLHTYIWSLRQREEVRAILSERTSLRYSPFGHLSIGAWFTLSILLLAGSVLFLVRQASYGELIIWFMGLPFGAMASLIMHWFGDVRTHARSALRIVSYSVVVMVFTVLIMLTMEMLAPSDLDAEHSIRFMPPAMLGLMFSQTLTALVLTFFQHRKPIAPRGDSETANTDPPQEHNLPSQTQGEPE